MVCSFYCFVLQTTQLIVDEAIGTGSIDSGDSLPSSCCDRSRIASVC